MHFKKNQSISKSKSSSYCISILLSFTCIRMWRIKLPLCLTTFPQITHFNLLSWSAMWACNSGSLFSTWPHRSHRKKFWLESAALSVCPVSCMVMCRDRYTADLSSLPQMWHMYLPISWSASWCAFISDIFWNTRPQMPHFFVLCISRTWFWKIGMRD